MSNEMTPRQMWAAALRSGAFQQYQNRLRSAMYPDKMCCLGVACEVYRIHTGRGYWDDQGFFAIDGYSYGYTLPPPVRKWLGVDHENAPFVHQDDFTGKGGLYHRRGDVCSMIDMNDYHEASFEEIADAIDQIPIHHSA